MSCSPVKQHLSVAAKRASVLYPSGRYFIGPINARNQPHGDGRMFNHDGSLREWGQWCAGTHCFRNWALLIACDEYGTLTTTGLRTLTRSLTDAASLRIVLEPAGFRCITLKDMNKTDMEAGVSSFASKLEPGDQVIIFFTGHGNEAVGCNFLIPSGFNRLAGDGVLEHAVAVSWIQQQLPRNVHCTWLLDCCRERIPMASLATEPEGVTKGKDYFAFAMHSGYTVTEGRTFMQCLLPFLELSKGIRIAEAVDQAAKECTRLKFPTPVPVGLASHSILWNPTLEQMDAVEAEQEGRAATEAAAKAAAEQRAAAARVQRSKRSANAATSTLIVSGLSNEQQSGNRRNVSRADRRDGAERLSQAGRNAELQRHRDQAHSSSAASDEEKDDSTPPASASPYVSAVASSAFSAPCLPATAAASDDELMRLRALVATLTQRSSEAHKQNALTAAAFRGQRSSDAPVAAAAASQAAGSKRKQNASEADNNASAVAADQSFESQTS